jgi:hypothetical protein
MTAGNNANELPVVAWTRVKHEGPESLCPLFVLGARPPGWSAEYQSLADHATATALIQSLQAQVQALRQAADKVIRRMQMDIDDGSRPDQWSMEDMVRTLRAAMKDKGENNDKRTTDS